MTGDGKKKQKGPPSQRRTFLLLVSMFLHAQIIIIVIATGSLFLTNQIRAYTTGEGLYAKAQKQAVIALQRYALSEDPSDYAEFEQKIAVTLGDRLARETLDSPSPDTERARDGLVQGRNHPDDVSGMVTVFLLFRDTSLFRPAIDLWAEADAIVAQIAEQGEALRQVVQAQAAGAETDEARRRAILQGVYALDSEVTLLQDEFSELLGDISRTITNYAILLLVGASLLLWIVSLAFGLRLHRRSVDAEQQLIFREQRLRALMNSTADGIISIDGDGRIVGANRATETMLGFAATVLQGRPAELVVADSSRNGFNAAMRAARAGAATPDDSGGMTLDGLRADATTFPAEIVLSRVEGSTDGRLIMMLRDITQRLSTEARLFQAQKMEAVGQLTGGVAHDFNNLLTVITGNLELLQDDLGDPGARDEAERQIKAALAAADRGARVTSHLLAFSRRQPLAPRPVDVDHLIRNMRELFEQTVSGAVKLRYELESFGWRAMVDHVQLENALLNLVLNARHATPDGGTITIASQHAKPDDEALEELELAPGEYIRITVTDTGSGIDPAIVDKVFEPFFTTREVGAGTGLGLSMVHGFVKQSGGQVRLQSEQGKGTVVELFLPRAETVTLEGTTIRRKFASAVGASVLVVEDHPALCLLAVRMLESHGYVAEGLPDAVKGLERIRKGPLPDLLLSDIVLPEGMDGFELVSRVQEEYPEVAVLLMSGFPRDALEGRADTSVALLTKPFTKQELLEAVGKALAKRKTPRSAEHDS